MRTTFAWFTSKDEVTNRLTATSDYGVSIAENFQPPENWIPGQKINKDVSAVNTGNVDAFVRTWLTGEMKVLNTTKLNDDTYGVLNSAFKNKLSGTSLNNTTDESLKAVGLTKYETLTTNEGKDENIYYKQLSVAQTENPQNNGENNVTDGYTYNGKIGDKGSTDDDTNTLPNSAAYSEVQSIQAGGQLVYALSNAEYEYVTNQATELPLYFGLDGSNEPIIVTATVPRGYLVKVVSGDNLDSTSPKSGLVGTGPSSSGGNDIALGDVELATNNDWAVRADKTDDSQKVNTVYVIAQKTSNTDLFAPVSIDSETFAPSTPGTYIFARNVDSKNAKVNKDNLDDYEFAGYYFDAADATAAVANRTTTTAGLGNYWALKNADASGNNRSDYTLPKDYKITVGTETDNGSKPVLNLTFDKSSGSLLGIDLGANLEMYTAAYKVVENDKLLWTYDSDKNVLSAIYQGGTDIIPGDASDEDNDSDGNVDVYAKDKLAKKIKDDIVIDIQLANIATSNENDKWTVINGNGTDKTYYSYAQLDSTAGKYNTLSPGNNLIGTVATNALWTFYYTNDLEAGDTSTKLVDSVNLRETTQKEAFIAFDFDLSVNLESVQITIDELGDESTRPVNDDGVWDNSDTANTTGAYVDPTQPSSAQQNTNHEISEIHWNKTT